MSTIGMNFQDSFLEALHAESIAGTENLTAWIKQIQDLGNIEILFELETWLRGIRSFLQIAHLPLSEKERDDMLERSFAPEIGILKTALEACEGCATQLISYIKPARVEFESFLESQMRKDSVLDYHVNKILEQPSPSESLMKLLESLNDYQLVIDGLQDKAKTFQLFLAVGRSFQRDIRNCRYVDMLLSQRFRAQYDRMQNLSVGQALRSIAEEKIRRDVTLALLHLFRLLHYLTIISCTLDQDKPLKQNLIVFSLLHEEIELLSDFLKSRFLKGRDIGHALRNAIELVVYSLKSESQRAIEKELIGLAQDWEVPAVYIKVEKSHGLLQNCFQSCVVTLLQTYQKDFDAKSIFPAMVDKQQQAQRLKQDLWNLRQFIRDVLERKEELDSHRIVERITAFKESSLKHLMYSDWAEFEKFSDALISADNRIEIRTSLRQFGHYLESLVQEVGKRKVFVQKTEEAS
jgi:hypothetical protein